MGIPSHLESDDVAGPDPDRNPGPRGLAAANWETEAGGEHLVEGSGFPRHNTIHGDPHRIEPIWILGAEGPSDAVWGGGGGPGLHGRVVQRERELGRAGPGPLFETRRQQQNQRP